ncbi:MAG: helix-turn-helix domain-containing protein, partial [Gemmatimonadaceae bacterium]
SQGKRNLRSMTLPPVPKPMSAKDVRGTRRILQASQGVLARYLNVSTKLVQAWEAGERVPSGPALVLLRMIEQQPGLVDMFHARTARTNGHRATASESLSGSARR